MPMENANNAQVPAGSHDDPPIVPPISGTLDPSEAGEVKILGQDEGPLPGGEDAMREDAVVRDPEEEGARLLAALEAHLAKNPLTVDANGVPVSPDLSGSPKHLSEERMPRKVTLHIEKVGDSPKKVTSLADIGQLGIQTTEATSDASADVHEESPDDTETPTLSSLLGHGSSAPKIVMSGEVEMQGEIARGGALTESDKSENVPANDAEHDAKGDEEDPAMKAIRELNEVVASKGEGHAEGDPKNAEAERARFLSSMGRALKHIDRVQTDPLLGVSYDDIVASFLLGKRKAEKEGNDKIEKASRLASLTFLKGRGLSESAAQSVLDFMEEKMRHGRSIVADIKKDSGAYRLRQKGVHRNTLGWLGVDVAGIDPNLPISPEMLLDLEKSVGMRSPEERTRAIGKILGLYKKTHARQRHNDQHPGDPQNVRTRGSTEDTSLPAQSGDTMKNEAPRTDGQEEEVTHAEDIETLGAEAKELGNHEEAESSQAVPPVETEAVASDGAAESAPEDLGVDAFENTDLESSPDGQAAGVLEEAHAILADAEEPALQSDDLEAMKKPGVEDPEKIPDVDIVYGEPVRIPEASASGQTWKAIAFNAGTGHVVVRSGNVRRLIPLETFRVLNLESEVGFDIEELHIPEEKLDRYEAMIEYEDQMLRLERDWKEAELRGDTGVAAEIEVELVRVEGRYRSAELAFKAEHVEEQTGSDSEKGKLLAFYDHEIAEAKAKGDVEEAEKFEKRKADYLAAFGGAVVGAAAVGGTDAKAAGGDGAPSPVPAQPEVAPASPDAIAQALDPEVLKKYEEQFKVKKEDLESMPEFMSLTPGQQMIVLRNLNQQMVQNIKGEALKSYREKVESLTPQLSKEQKGYLAEPVSKPREWWRKFAVAAEQVAKKETWQRVGMNLMKDKILSDKEKELAEKLSSEGAPDQKELIRTLATMAKEGPDVEVGPDGKLTQQYISEREFGGNLSEEERGRIATFNAAVQNYMEVKRPDALNIGIDAKVEGRVNSVLDAISTKFSGRATRDHEEAEKFAAAKAAYDTALHDMLELGRERIGGEAMVEKINGIDTDALAQQYFNTNPGAERLLSDIKSQSSWMRWAKSSSRVRLGSFAVGGATRMVAVGSLAAIGGGAVAGILAAPFAGYGVGRMMGRQRARTDLEEKDVLEKMGVDTRNKAARERMDTIKTRIAEIPADTTDPTLGQERAALSRELGTIAFEADKTSRNIVSAERLMEKLARTESQIETLDAMLTSGLAGDRADEVKERRDRLAQSLDARYAYTREKLEKGLVDMGSDDAERARHMLELTRAMKSAFATSVVEKKWDAELKDRTKKFLSYKEGAISKRQAEFLDVRGKQAAKIGAMFAAGGAIATDVVSSSLTGRGVSAELLGIGKEDGTGSGDGLSPEIIAAIQASQRAEGLKEVPGMLETLPEEEVAAIQGDMQIGEIRSIAGTTEFVFKMPNGNLSNAASLEAAQKAIKEMQDEAQAAAILGPTDGETVTEAPPVDAVSAATPSSAPKADIAAPGATADPSPLQWTKVPPPDELQWTKVPVSETTEMPSPGPTELERSTLGATPVELPTEGNIAKTEAELLEQFRRNSAEISDPNKLMWEKGTVPGSEVEAAAVAPQAMERAPIPAYTIAGGDNLENILRGNVPEIAELPNRAAQLNAIHNLLGKMKPEELQSLGITTDGKYGIEAGKTLDLNAFRDALFDPERTVRGRSILERAQEFGALRGSSSPATEVITVSAVTRATEVPLDARSWLELAPEAKQSMAREVGAEMFMKEDVVSVFADEAGVLSPKWEGLSKLPVERIINHKSDSALRFLDPETHELTLKMQKYLASKKWSGPDAAAPSEGETFQQFVERMRAEKFLSDKNMAAESLLSKDAPSPVPDVSATESAEDALANAVPAEAGMEKLTPEGEKLFDRTIETYRNMLGASEGKTVAEVLDDAELAQRTRLPQRLSEIRKAGYMYDTNDNILAVLKRGYRHVIAVEEAKGKTAGGAEVSPDTSAPSLSRTLRSPSAREVSSPAPAASPRVAPPDVSYEPVSGGVSHDAIQVPETLGVYDPVVGPARR